MRMDYKDFIATLAYLRRIVKSNDQIQFRVCVFYAFS